MGTISYLSSKIHIREMELDDLAAVYHLGERLFTKDNYPFLYSTWDKREVVGHFNTEPEFSLVAHAGDALAGFIIGTLTCKDSWAYGYIVWVGVDRRFQSKGVAHQLYEQLQDRMIKAGACQFVVDTDAGNAAAIRFFAKEGFEDEREHVVLTLNLTLADSRGDRVLERFPRACCEYIPRPQASMQVRDKPVSGVTIPESDFSRMRLKAPLLKRS